MEESYLPLTSSDSDLLLKILWGKKLNPDVFRRWNQGFVFSGSEPSALIQFDGGPCSVIASVEAFLLKNLFFINSPKSNWRQLAESEQQSLLCSSLCDIFEQVAEDEVYQLVLIDKSSCGSDNETIVTDIFHKAIRTRQLKSLVGLKEELTNHLSLFSDTWGCLLFLYSILLTKGLTKVSDEIGDIEESLIDPVHGHGTQSLINLLLTGKAVSYVWDNVKDVSGLQLIGISSKSQVGFLTLLEHLRYCEVGWFLKNPQYPIWVLGSETHLTVLFSEDKSLVGEEDVDSMARRIFTQYDKEGRGFINSEVLGDVMKSLDLFADPEYVKIMINKLDPEQLGIITLNDFLEEFFPRNKDSFNSSCHKFTVYHYNGLQRSCANNTVTYSEALCCLMDLPELQMVSDYSPIKTCLLTKWPTIEITWKNNVIPSLN